MERLGSAISLKNFLGPLKFCSLLPPSADLHAKESWPGHAWRPHLKKGWRDCSGLFEWLAIFNIDYSKGTLGSGNLEKTASVEMNEWMNGRQPLQWPSSCQLHFLLNCKFFKDWHLLLESLSHIILAVPCESMNEWITQLYYLAI